MKRILITTFLILLLVNISKSQSWVELGSGNNTLKPNIWIDQVITDKSGNVYAGGKFTDSIFSVYEVNYIGKWNGNTWTRIHEASSPIAIDDSQNVYTAVTTGLGLTIQKWGGNKWIIPNQFYQAIQMNQIDIMLIDSSYNFYLSGNFDITNPNVSSQTFSVAKWDGNTWTGLGVYFDGINSMVKDRFGNLYVAGSFISSDAAYTHNYNRYVARWNDTSWVEVGVGTNALIANDDINSIAVDNSGNIYAGGLFTNSKGKYYVAKWDGSTWSQLGKDSIITGNITSIIVDKNNNIYVAGFFQDLNGNGYVAKWDGTKWNQLGGQTPYGVWGLYGQINSITLDQSNNLYAGGQFEDANNYPYVAQWNPNSTATSTINQINISTISIYPNPSSGLIHINTLENGVLTIYNLLGELITTKQVYEGVSDVDLTNQQTGMYTIVFTNQSNTYTPVKWIKE
jgi:hypothetical protein